MSMRMGYDLSLTRAPIEPISPAAGGDAARAASRSSTRARATGPTSPTCRPTSAGARSGSAPASAIRGRAGASWCAASRAGRSSPSWRPLPGEPIIDKPGKGSFCATDLELILRQRGIRNIVLTGITTDVCVHTTMREANDRGFECLLLEDCCGATDRGNHVAALKMVKMQGGVFGAVARSADSAEGAAMNAARVLPHPRERRPRPRSRRHDQALRRVHRAGRRVDARSRPAASMRCWARTAPASDAGQVHHGLSTAPTAARSRSTASGARDRQPARRPRAGHRHGLPALHAGARHDRGREPRHVARRWSRR